MNKKNNHKQHRFIVDKSNTFSRCAVCGKIIKRKTGPW